MKKTSLLILLFSLFVLTIPAYAVHEAREALVPTAVGASASLTYYPKFISRRGFEFGNGSVQPSATVLYGPFSFNAWSTYNVNDWTAKKANVRVENKHTILETDWWMTYTKVFDKLTTTAGYFYEGFDTGLPSPQNTYEVFLVFHYDTFLQPGFEIYWDPDKGDGTFFFATVSHNFSLPKNMNLNLTGWVNYNNDNKIYGDFSKFYNGQVAASLSIPLTKEISIVPRIGYSVPLSNEAKDALSAFNKSGRAEHFWGGLSVVAAFMR
jgi:hypothetical protein